MWITNLNRLVSAQCISDGHKASICNRCSKLFYDHTLKSGQKISGEWKLEKHLQECIKYEAVRTETPQWPCNTIKFKNFNTNTLL
jgi:hypothetical protein